MFDPTTLTLHQLVEMGFEQNCSDIYVKAGTVPKMKRYSRLVPVSPDIPVLDEQNVRRMLGMVMSERQRRVFEETCEMDLAFEVVGKCRIRANLYMQRGGWAIVMRTIPLRIKTVEDLGLPVVLKELIKHKQGLVLVTGPTGSGKTTSLAALLDLINETRDCHIVTVEDPLEFSHPDKQSFVSQREVGIDTLDFQPALRAVLREAPDVILIGEMRDVATMNAALQAGETGHLVFSTVHTKSAYETMDRIINMFPPHEKMYLCQRMGGSLRAIVAQQLVPRADGEGRVPAVEVLICTPTVTKAIEDGHFSDLYQHMNEGGFWGMQTMNQSLVKYVKAGLITEQTAMTYAGVASELKQMLRRA